MNGAIDRDQVNRWLEEKHVTLWAVFDVVSTDRRQAAAEWFAKELESFGKFALAEAEAQDEAIAWRDDQEAWRRNEARFVDPYADHTVGNDFHKPWLQLQQQEALR